MRGADFASRVRAAALRRGSSMPERILWGRLRAKRLGGLKFRRQHPIGPYTLDFYCDELRLAVEVDGRSHEERRERDAARDVWLQARGIETIRVPAGDVTRDVDGVCVRLLAEVGRRRRRAEE